MVASPLSLLSSRLYDYVSKGILYHAQIEFPAALVPLQSGLNSEDDDMIVMEILDNVVRIVYTDFHSDYVENSSNENWTLFDRHGQKAFHVLFHDVDNDEDWIRDNVIVRVMGTQGVSLAAQELEALEALVSEFEVFPYYYGGLM
jgi:hypothetical protein